MRRTLSRLRWPDANVTRRAGTPRYSATCLHTLVLAFPSTGAAVVRTSRRPARRPPTLFRLAPGTTRMASRVSSLGFDTGARIRDHRRPRRPENVTVTSETEATDSPTLAKELSDEDGVRVLDGGEGLTILHVVMAKRPADAGNPIPHNHRMSAVIGVIYGTEENGFRTLLADPRAVWSTRARRVRRARDGQRHDPLGEEPFERTAIKRVARLQRRPHRRREEHVV